MRGTACVSRSLDHYTARMRVYAFAFLYIYMKVYRNVCGSNVFP